MCHEITNSRLPLLPLPWDYSLKLVACCFCQRQQLALLSSQETNQTQLNFFELLFPLLHRYWYQQTTSRQRYHFFVAIILIWVIEGTSLQQSQPCVSV